MSADPLEAKERKEVLATWDVMVHQESKEPPAPMAFPEKTGPQDVMVMMAPVDLLDLLEPRDQG